MGFDEIIEKLNDDSDKVIDSYIQDVVDASGEDKTKLSELDEEVLLAIFLLWNTAVEDVAQAVVDDINEQSDKDEEGSIPESVITDHKEAGVFFFSEAFRRVSYRAHGANVATQLNDDDEEKEEEARQEEIDEAIEKGKNDVHNSSVAELAFAYSVFTKSEQIARGLLNYRWDTKRDNRVRPAHKANEGLIFSWMNPPATGHPGQSYGCRCKATLFDESPRDETEFQKKLTENKNMPKDIENSLPFKILNESENKMSINITGEIGDEWWDEDSQNNTMNKVSNVLHDSLSDIDIYINSNGGDLSHGVAIYNLLTKHPATINTYVIGHAHSSASIIFMAGDNRYMPKGATSIIHNPWSCLCGDYQAGEKYTKQMKQFAESIVDIYADKMTSSKDDIRGMLDREDVIISSEAVALGYATDEIDFKSGNIDSSIKNVIDDDKQIAQARDEISKMRVCGVNNSIKEDTMPRSRDEETLDLKDELSQIKAKLKIAEKSNEDLKASNKDLKDNESALESKIDGLSAEIEKGVEEAKVEEVRAKLEKANIEAKGETSDELKRNVLAEFNVDNAKDFEGKVLDSMFDYVLKQSNDSNEADSVYADGVDEPNEDASGDVFAKTNDLMGK